MNHRTTMFVLSAVLMLSGARGAEREDIRARIIAVAGKARQLKSAGRLGAKGQAAALIAEVNGIDAGDQAGDQERIMKLSLLGELHALNGDYDTSNRRYREAYALQSNFGFYRKMVVNMRLKGDDTAARAVVEEYKRVVDKELPAASDALRRQDLVQFVETALNEELPGGKTGEPPAGGGP